MPVTVRLLQRLQETLGEEATGDMVAWLNEVTGTSREAMREVAELYFARFETRNDRAAGGAHHHAQPALTARRLSVPTAKTARDSGRGTPRTNRR